MGEQKFDVAKGREAATAPSIANPRDRMRTNTPKTANARNCSSVEPESDLMMNFPGFTF